MSELEEKLIQDIRSGENVSLERALFIISGLATEREIKRYIGKLDEIHNGFTEKLKTKSPLNLSATRKYLVSFHAKLLFEYLWNSKPKRYDSNFLLTDVINAQLNRDINQKVGSCVGLTSLYTVLGLRENLNLTIMVSDSHIVNRLRLDNTLADIDNTDPFGFDCNIEEKNFREFPSLKLLANVLNSRGMAQERIDNFEKANEDYEKAIEINPEYANAYNNRGNIKSKQADYTGAIKDYNKAIELNKRFVEVHYNRGIAKENVGDYFGAIEDFDRAIELNPDYSDSYFRRGVVKQYLRDYDSAMRDFNKVIELTPKFRDRVARFRDRG